MAPTAPRLPVGRFLCGMVTLCFTAAMLFQWASAERDPVTFDVVFRGGCMLLVMLGVITTEAIWRARPEAYRASVALAVCFAAWVMRGAVQQQNVIESAWFLASCAIVYLPVLRYLRGPLRPLWPRGGLRVRAPRP
jgi:hypothetical protein